MLVVTVNVGSTSIRLGAHGGPQEGFTLRAAAHLSLDGAADPGDALDRFLRWHGFGRVDAVVHRIVHGGPTLVAPCPCTSDARLALAEVAPLAPLYTPRALAWIEAAQALAGAPPSLLVTDTRFFADLPPAAATYALPRALADRYGIRRYGFHGLAHRSLLRAFETAHPELAREGRVVTLQLGAGCSAAAIRAGKPVDTSMGFSPLEGLVMATRPGDLDAGALLQLLRASEMSLDELEHVLQHESGLLGVSGLSPDVRELRLAHTPAARLALEIYALRARKYVGSYLAELGGADAVLVGGGVGEHDPEMREAILGGLDALGLSLDVQANREGHGRPLRLTRAGSRIEAMVVAVDESLEMLIEAAPLLGRLAAA